MFFIWLGVLSTTQLVYLQCTSFKTGTFFSPCITSEGFLDNLRFMSFVTEVPQRIGESGCVGQVVAGHTALQEACLLLFRGSAMRVIRSSTLRGLRCLRACVALAEDQGLISSTHVAVHNPNSSLIGSSSDLGGYHTCMQALVHTTYIWDSFVRLWNISINSEFLLKFSFYLSVCLSVCLCRAWVLNLELCVCLAKGTDTDLYSQFHVVNLNLKVQKKISFTSVFFLLDLSYFLYIFLLP